MALNTIAKLYAIEKQCKTMSARAALSGSSKEKSAHIKSV